MAQTTIILDDTCAKLNLVAIIISRAVAKMLQPDEAAAFTHLQQAIEQAMRPELVSEAKDLCAQNPTLLAMVGGRAAL